MLATFELRERLDLVLEFLRQRVEVLRISREIDERTKGAFDERQKEAVLRERLRQIRKELGEDEEGSGEIAELKAELAKAGMPAEIEEHVRDADRAARAHGRGQRRVLDDALLPGVDAGAAMVEARQAKQIDIERARRRCWMRIISGSRPSSAASSSFWRCASSIPKDTARSCASSGRPASARPRWDSRSRARSDSSSCA